MNIQTCNTNLKKHNFNFAVNHIIQLMATVLITGGTGLIGIALTKMLVSKNYEVIVLTRRPAGADRSLPKISYAQWNIEKNTIDKEAVLKADYIVHLAGANVGEKRWTAKRKKEIVESRTKSSELLVNVLQEIPDKVKAVISASAIGWYGEDTSLSKQKGFREEDEASGDFLGQTCKQWEEKIKRVETLVKRLVVLRQGLVLSNDGGAYTEFKKPLKFGIVPILGSGKQMMSWIHVEDLCSMYIYVLENNLEGVFNAVAPGRASNKTFTLQLAKKLRGKFFIPVPVPSLALKIVLGEMSIEVLKSATVSCEKIQSTGFRFLYPSIEEALKNL
jgi:uncharacterized protein (TIGR01777 family)